MATRYWVGGTGNWSSTARWSATSGGAGGQSVPTSVDFVIIDANSGTAADVINLDVTGNCSSFNVNSTSNFTGSMQWNTNVINVYGTTQSVSIGSTVAVTMLGTPVINAMYSGASELQMFMGNQTEANAISVNIVGAATGARVFNLGTHAVKNVNFLNYAGTITQGPSVYGDATLNTAGTYTSMTQFRFAGAAASTFTTVGKTISSAVIAKTGSGSVTLADALTATGTITLTSGNLNLNSQTFATGSFSSSNANVRSITFGTSFITCNGTGTVWDTAGATNFSYTGTPLVKISNNTATAATVFSGAMTEAQALSFNFTTGTYALTFLAGTGYSCKDVDFTGFAGTLAATSTGVIYGNLTLSTGMTLTASASALTFAGTSGTKTITSNGKTMDFPVTFNGVGAAWRLLDALTVGATRITTLTNGTLDLDGKTLTTGFFTSISGTARTLSFGTGNIICNAANGSLWNTSTATNLTVTGTPVVNISNSGAVATTVAPGILTEAQAISFNFTTGTYVLTFLATASYSAKNVDFTGFAGRWAAITSNTIYGNLTISTGMTLTASTGVLRFGATSGTQLVTTNGKTVDFPVTFNGVGGTFKLLDALTMGATRVLTFTNGTFDGDNKTISGASSISLGGTVVKNVLTAVPTVTNSLTALTMGGPNTFGTFGVFDAISGLSYIDISSYQLTCTSFSSTGSSAKTLYFSGGNITCNGAGGTLFTASAAMVTTGTPIVNIVYSGATAVTVTPGAYPESQAFSFNFTAGTYALTFLAPTSNLSAKNIDFTGFAGTWNGTANGIIYGNLTLSTGMTVALSTQALTFGATSGVQLITSNGKTQDKPLTIDGVGGTVRLADALLMGTARAFTHTNGTLDLNGKTLTVGATYATAAGTKDITFNGGTLVCPAVTVTAFNNAAPTGFTTTAGTGTGKISMTGATGKTFVGGGATYNCTLSNNGAGALTISGSNTFAAIANSVQPTAFTFTAATTQTVTDWNVSGTAGNLVTIISSTAGTAATLSKASGIVSSNYLSLKDSTATGGAAWYAGTTSTNVSGNLGWIFTAPPATSSNGNFFFMF